VSGNGKAPVPEAIAKLLANEAQDRRQLRSWLPMQHGGQLDNQKSHAVVDALYAALRGALDALKTSEANVKGKQYAAEFYKRELDTALARIAELEDRYCTHNVCATLTAASINASAHRATRPTDVDAADVLGGG